MPYIDKASRMSFDHLGVPIPDDGGQLQYLIAEMIDLMLMEKTYDRSIRYADLESIMGALAGAQAEFYRKVVAPYEDKKIVENGRVYRPEFYFEN